MGIKVKNKMIVAFALSMAISFPVTQTATSAILPGDHARSNREIKRIVQSIKALAKISDDKAENTAVAIFKASETHKIDAKLMVAILMQESTFRQGVVSSTGDFSISQINYNIWNKEFRRLKKAPLDINRLKKDKEYAIKRMAEILEILAKRRKNPDWFALYHSGNPVNKELYKRKIITHLSKIDRF